MSTHDQGSAEIRAHMARREAEYAEREARRAAITLPPRRTRRITGPSVVYSIRLDPAEVAALEARAEIEDIKPTVLARNLVRAGLVAKQSEAAATALDRLAAAMDELRAVLRV